jgi:enoyl-CoA hydratase
LSAGAEIRFERRGPLGRAFKARLDAWAQDPAVEAVVVRGAGERAFCAGGDIRAIWDSGHGDGVLAARFFRTEYGLNRRIFTFQKPYLALIDGVTMGGGVGVSVHGSHRIASEATLFAMPETGIGFFPDVGGSYFLPRLAGRLGLYLGLTGARLKAADCLYGGIATHYVGRARHDELIELLAGAPWSGDRRKTRWPLSPATRDRHPWRNTEPPSTAASPAPRSRRSSRPCRRRRATGPSGC